MLFNFESGELLLIDKPFGWTSFDVVKKVRNAIRIKKIGHAGTLDPLASGLLVLCTGKMTKQIDQIQVQEKEYTGEIVIGKTTPSFDLETDFDSSTDIEYITKAMVYDAAHKHVGLQDQLPPVYSAIKINGQRLYKLARRGESVELKPRQIEIKEFEITAIALPAISFRVVCSKGTYIRSLASDFGKALGVGAYLSALRRTKVGVYDVQNAYQLQDLIAEVNRQKERAIMEPVKDGGLL